MPFSAPPALPAPAPRPVLTARSVADLAAALRARSLLRRRGIALAAPGLSGRVVRVGPGETLDRWDPKPRRRLVFFLAGGALALLARSESDRSFLIALGYPEAFIASEQARGARFQLVLFRPAGEARPATWANLARAVAQGWGEAIGRRVAGALPALEAGSMADFERAAGATLAAAGDPAHPAHVTAERLAALPESAVQPWQVRFFLALEANVNALFAGDGVTRDARGARGFAETVGPNGPIAAAGDWRAVELAP